MLPIINIVYKIYINNNTIMALFVFIMPKLILPLNNVSIVKYWLKVGFIKFASQTDMFCLHALKSIYVIIDLIKI